MPVQSFDDTNAFYRVMRSFASTKVGVAIFRPTGHHLDRLVAKLTGGRTSFTGIASAWRDTWRATARLATDSERDEIWAKGLEVYPGWRKYETRAGDRHIEAFVLSRD